MTSRLTFLRSQLAGLSQARSRVRAVTAWSALAIAVLGALAAFFVLDLIFELAVPQRIVVLAAAAAAVGWAFWRFTRPLLGHHEGEIEMALLVERQQKIDNDLVAALQFERPGAEHWGSPQLSVAVIEYVAAVGRGINVFEGFSKEQMQRRLGILAAGIAIGLLLYGAWPGHVAALANRLLLGSQHYPTRTRIDQVIINRSPVLVEGASVTAPQDCKQPQGRPLAFLVQCSGELPPMGSIHLTASDSSHSRTRLTLMPLSLDERRARLELALRNLNDAIQENLAAISPPWRDELRTLLRFDAPQALDPLEKAKGHADLAAVVSTVSTVVQRWPGESGRTSLFAGELGRLNESLTYKLFIGDAWTDTASIQMIPLPIVELRITPEPPPYARGDVEPPDSSGRQFAVLENSSVELAIECVNRKQLQKAWLKVQGKGTADQHDLTPQDGTKLAWTAHGVAALKRIREELRYEIQVIDEDGLSLETPIRGTIRIRPDRPPTGIAEVIHRVVLPSASPVIEYRASDDHGLSRVALILELERGGAKNPPAPAATSALGTTEASSETNLIPAAIVPTETHRYEVFARGQTRGDEFSAGGGLTGFHTLTLAQLKLTKGDRLKLTLEVTDYRGENEQGDATGVAYQSDPLMLEISDEAGVLAAISEADLRSEERLTEIIKRQLGIGEAP